MARIARLFFAGLALSLALPLAAAQAGVVAVDPTGVGPLTVRSSEYKLPAVADPEIDSTVVTELWARIYRPKQLGSSPHPVIVMLHGNHATCGHYVKGIKGRVDDDTTYTFTGKCPDGYVVVPSHEGYAYVAETLASWGYVVVSINANRGVNAAGGVSGDEGLNLRRARLVLRHLEQLDQWNHNGGAPASLHFDLKGVLDFGHIGLMGHSRGGEGMIAAYTLYHDPGSVWPGRFITQPTIEAVFELAPVDGQTDRTFYADNIPWTVLLPLCDGDVSDLEGVRVYDRTNEALAETQPARKSVYAVWGANHNFFNTQWQQSDSSGCVGAGNKALFNQREAGSVSEQTTGAYGMLGFFRSRVGPGADPTLGQLLNTSFDLPAPLVAVTNLERSFAESAAKAQNGVVEAFTGPVGTNSSGNPNDLSHITMSHGGVTDHDVTLSAGAISWSKGGGQAPAGAFFQSNWTPAGAGRRVDAYQTLEFRVARQNLVSSGKPVGTDFSIALADAGGGLSTSVRLSSYAALYAPVGSFYGHPILQTVRIPLADFKLAAGTKVHGVRFAFDQTRSGDIYLADIRVSRPIPGTVDAATGAGEPVAHVSSAAAMAPAPALPVTAKGRVAAIRRAAAGKVEIELESRDPLPVRDALMVLRIGDRTFRVSRFTNRGSTYSVAFALSAADLAALPQGAPVVVESGADRWGFGTLDKGPAQ